MHVRNKSIECIELHSNRITTPQSLYNDNGSAFLSLIPTMEDIVIVGGGVPGLAIVLALHRQVLSIRFNFSFEVSTLEFNL